MPFFCTFAVKRTDGREITEYVQSFESRNQFKPLKVSYSQFDVVMKDLLSVPECHIILHHQTDDTGQVDQKFCISHSLEGSNLQLVLTNSKGSVECEFYTEARQWDLWSRDARVHLQKVAYTIGEKVHNCCRQRDVPVELLRPKAVAYELLKSQETLSIEGRTSGITRCQYRFGERVEIYEEFMEDLKADFAKFSLAIPAVNGSIGLSVYESVFVEKELGYLEKRVLKFVQKDPRPHYDTKALQPMTKLLGHLVNHLAKCGLVEESFSMDHYDLFYNETSVLPNCRSQFCQPAAFIQLFGESQLLGTDGTESVCGVSLPRGSVSMLWQDSFFSETLLRYNPGSDTGVLLVLRKKAQA